MAYESGTASSTGDLLVKLFDFLDGTGNWTIELDIASAAQSPAFGFISSIASPESDKLISLGLEWATSHIDLVPNRGYLGSGDPSSQKDVTDNAGVFPRVDFQGESGPYTAYHFFEDAGNYCHGVVEYSTGFYRHFGFGQLTKAGNWRGGEYYYGQYVNPIASSIDNPISSQHYMGIDATWLSGSIPDRYCHVFAQKADGSPLDHIAGRQSPESRWFVVTNNAESGSGQGTDGNGAQKGTMDVIPGFRYGGWDFSMLGGPNSHNGFRPLAPFKFFVTDGSVTPDQWQFVGSAKDIRRVSMDGLSPGETISIGGDTWRCFPVVRIGDFSNTDTEFSYDWGVAYKQVT